MRSVSSLSGLILSATIVIVAGCAGGKRDASQPAVVKEAQLAVPKYTIASNVSTVGSVSLSISPRDFSSKEESCPSNVSEAATWFTTEPGARNYDISYLTFQMPEGQGVDFTVEVVNDSDQAVSFDKAIIGISINGRLVNITQDKYRELHKIAIPPKARTGDIHFAGYALEQHENGTVRVDVSNVMVGSEAKSFAFTMQSDSSYIPLRCLVHTIQQLMQPGKAAAIQAKTGVAQQRAIVFDKWYALAQKNRK